jgi:predicted DsbA family dithiol-disulfide isomerase
MAFASPLVTAVAVEATEFPDLARKYRVTGVPKTVVNDQVEIMGAVPQDMFVPAAIEALSAAAQEPEGRA